MKPEYHAIISLTTSVIFYLVTNSMIGSILCFLVGIFIDLDHFPDFWIFGKKRISFNIKDFFDYFYKHDYEKAVIIFHTVEFIPLILVIGQAILGKTLTYGILTGFVVHLLFDYAGNGVEPLTYFLSYRIYKKFDVSYFCKCKKNI